MMRIDVLDKGFVELVDRMGDDYSAVQAARVSYGKGLTSKDRDDRLIRYLMEHGHHSPFEHIVFKFHLKLPIFVMRQLVRHRIASINERSGRYTEFSDEWYLPDSIRTPDGENKQGSVECADKAITQKAIAIIGEAYKNAFVAYSRLIEMGVAKEMARIVLPTSMYTEAYWTINGRSIMNFLNQRADSHAQPEIQLYASAIAEIFEAKCPVVYDAFIRYNYTGDLLNKEVRG
jgi:thymidylate synthase (FAD)